MRKLRNLLIIAVIGVSLQSCAVSDQSVSDLTGIALQGVAESKNRDELVKAQKLLKETLAKVDAALEKKPSDEIIIDE